MRVIDGIVHPQLLFYCRSPSLFILESNIVSYFSNTFTSFPGLSPFSVYLSWCRTASSVISIFFRIHALGYLHQLKFFPFWVLVYVTLSLDCIFFHDHLLILLVFSCFLLVWSSWLNLFFIYYLSWNFSLAWFFIWFS